MLVMSRTPVGNISMQLVCQFSPHLAPASSSPTPASPQTEPQTDDAQETAEEDLSLSVLAFSVGHHGIDLLRKASKSGKTDSVGMRPLCW